MWHLTVPVKSHKAQLEAMRSSKHSDFEEDLVGNTTVLSNKKSCSRNRFCVR